MIQAEIYTSSLKLARFMENVSTLMNTFLDSPPGNAWTWAIKI
jgi:hypothetical protein